MTETPLHVKVAEALGWTECRPGDEHFPSVVPPSTDWFGKRPANDHVYGGMTTFGADGAWFGVPHFDTRWAATGPLIERYGIGLDCEPLEEAKYRWRARPNLGHDGDGIDFGPTPLIAVCNLILAQGGGKARAVSRKLKILAVLFLIQTVTLAYACVCIYRAAPWVEP